MTIAEFLLMLRGRDIRVWLENDRLKVSAPEGSLTPEMRETLAGRKSEILDFLRRAKALGSGPRAIVPLRAEGTRPPLFAIPGHGGDVFCYVPMLPYLNPDQPLLGVQPPGLEGADPIRSVPALAAYAVEQIRRYQPNGPYLIAGYCAGGTVAFEVARQLTDAEQEVGMLAILGSPHPATYRRGWTTLRTIAHYAGRLRHHAGKALSGSVADGVAHVWGVLRRRLRPGNENSAAPLDATSATLRVQRATLAGIRAYRPGGYSGEVDLFLPSEEFATGGCRPRRWKKLAHVVREHMHPEQCTLDEMLREPHVAGVAAMLERRLSELDRGWRSSAIRVAPGKSA